MGQKNTEQNTEILRAVTHLHFLHSSALNSPYQTPCFAKKRAFCQNRQSDGNEPLQTLESTTSRRFLPLFSSIAFCPGD